MFCPQVHDSNWDKDLYILFIYLFALTFDLCLVLEVLPFDSHLYSGIMVFECSQRLSKENNQQKCGVFHPNLELGSFLSHPETASNRSKSRNKNRNRNKRRSRTWQAASVGLSPKSQNGRNSGFCNGAVVWQGCSRFFAESTSMFWASTENFQCQEVIREDVGHEKFAKIDKTQHPWKLACLGQPPGWTGLENHTLSLSRALDNMPNKTKYRYISTVSIYDIIFLDNCRHPNVWPSKRTPPLKL